MSKKALTTVDEKKNGSNAQDPKAMKKGTETKKVVYKTPTKVVKRDGRIENFEASRIEVAITRCFKGLNRTNFDAKKNNRTDCKYCFCKIRTADC
jgi:actin-like ATPase involved in cell morphogenesis